MDEKRNGTREKNPNKGRSMYLVNIIILCLITLVSLGVCVFLVLQLRSSEQNANSLSARLDQLEGDSKTLYTQDQLDEEVNKASNQAREQERSSILTQVQSSLESGNTTTSMLRSLFSEDLVVVNNGRYYFFPVYSSLDKSIVKSGDFEYDDTGTLQYLGSDQTIVIHRGVDVSARNGDIDWQSVADDGISFAMVCAGSADEEGTLTADAALTTNVSGARKQKVDVGAYFVMNAMDTGEAESQAEFVIHALSDVSKSITYPVAVVVREPDKDSRLSDLSRTEFTDNLIAFCSRIEKAGYTPLIYGNLAAFLMQTDLSRLNGYEKWIADFSNNVYFPYRYSFWQYSTSGQVNGIDGSVHLDLQIMKK